MVCYVLALFFTGNVLSSTVKRDEPTSILGIVNTSSQKIKKVIELYRNQEEICLPRIPDLEDDFDEIMADLHVALLEMDPPTIRKLIARVQLKYRRHLQGGSDQHHCLLYLTHQVDYTNLLQKNPLCMR